MAKKTYTEDLQTVLDDEIAALRAERASASPPVGGAPPAAVPAAPPSYGEADAPPAAASPTAASPTAAPPAPGLPYAAPAPPLPPLRRARGGLRPMVLALAVGLVVLLLGIVVFATQLANQGHGSIPGGPPSGSPPPVGVIYLAGLVVLLFLLALFLLARRRAAPPAVAHRESRERAAPILTASPQTIAALDQRIVRLEQLRSWMGEDPELGRLIDATIGAQVHASERRQRIFSGCVAVASLAVGWILNAVSLPAIVAGLFGH